MTIKETTREKLLEAAEEVFATKGYYEAAVDEIVRRSNTSKGSVYFYFPSKESLFLAVVDHLGDRLIQRVELAVADVSDPRQQLEVALVTTVETLTRHKSLASLLLSKGFGMGPSFVQKRREVFGRFADRLRELLEQALGQEKAAALNTEVVAYAWLGAISEVVVCWLETGKPHPVKEALPTLRRLLLGGVGLEAGSEEPR